MTTRNEKYLTVVIILLIILLIATHFPHRNIDPVCVLWSEWEETGDGGRTAECELTIENNADYQESCYWRYDCNTRRGEPFHCNSDYIDIKVCEE